jgi:hypothetical protein
MLRDLSKATQTAFVATTVSFQSPQTAEAAAKLMKSERDINTAHDQFRHTATNGLSV